MHGGVNTWPNYMHVFFLLSWFCLLLGQSCYMSIISVGVDVRCRKLEFVSYN